MLLDPGRGAVDAEELWAGMVVPRLQIALEGLTPKRAPIGGSATGLVIPALIKPLQPTLSLRDDTAAES